MGATTARADDSFITPAEIQTTLDFYREHGVSESQLNTLEGKMEAGVLPDAFLPGNLPVSTTTEVRFGIKATIERYADGSVARLEISDVKPGASTGITPFVLPGCTMVSSSPYQVKYQNCLAKKDWGVRLVQFRFNATQVNGGTGTIDSYYSATCTGLGSLSDKSFYRISASTVELTCHFSNNLGTGATTAYWVRATQGVNTSMTVTSGMVG